MPLLLRSENASVSNNIHNITLQNSIQGSYLLKSFVFNHQIYNVDTNNNTIAFNYSSTDESAALTPGNYNGTELATAIQTLMNTETGGSNFTVAFSTITAKLTITSASGSFTLTVANERQARLLGFNAIGAQTTGATLTSDKPCLLAFPYSSLSVRIGDNNDLGDDSGNNCTFNVPLYDNFGYRIIFEAGDKNMIYINFRQHTKRVEISFLDNDHAPIDINSSLFEILLEEC